MTTIIRDALPEDLLRCFPVMQELRPHLSVGDFCAQVERQWETGWRLTLLEVGGEVRALAGWRVAENLSWGRHVFVDDLVTSSDRRSSGCGSALFEYLVARGRAEGCGQLHLESGVQRFAAHRFYLRHRMEITCHHFGLVLGE